jgi:hypothetical protein
VATLIVLARESRGSAEWEAVARDEIEDGWVGVGADEEFDDLVLWVEIKKQVAILREGMEERNR